MYGVALYRRLAGETGVDPSWHEVGSLRLASSPERLEELKAVVASERDRQPAPVAVRDGRIFLALPFVFVALVAATPGSPFTPLLPSQPGGPFRWVAELTRLGCAMGGHQLTFSGLAGMGDLIATCISPQSRNRYVGEQLGRLLDDPTSSAVLRRAHTVLLGGGPIDPALRDRLLDREETAARNGDTQAGDLDLTGPPSGR